MMGDMIWLWIGFNVFVLGMLALDLGVFHRHSHTVSMKEAVTWSVVWISLALLFNLGIYLFWHQIVPSSAYSNSEASTEPISRDHGSACQPSRTPIRASNLPSPSPRPSRPVSR